MSASENLPAQMADKTNEQLLVMFKHPDDWLPEALDAARAELKQRGIEATTMPVSTPPLPQGQPVLFPVSPLKLVVMSTVTLGIYEIYWFYKNWKLVKQQTDRDIMPFWRAFFLVIFCYPFFKEVKQAAVSHEISFPSAPGLLAVVYIILKISWKLPDPFSLLCFLAPLVLVPVQNAINHLNTVVAPSHNTNARFSGWNIAATVVGGIFLVLIVIGTFLS